MEAQKLITLSINKIAGSRRQRGGINLRKNLLVASVLHSARIHYYEEMCNRMPGHITLEQSSSEPEMEDDCTESPDWDNDDENDQLGAEYAGELDTEEDNETAGNYACELGESCRVVVEPAQPVVVQSVAADKENVYPVGHSSCNHENVENSKADSHVCHSVDSDRVALSNVISNSQNSSVETCTTTTCLTVPSVKRKRTETEEACDSIVNNKRVKVDSQCQTATPERTTSSISSLVDIFKAGFHGLAGESSGKLTSYDVEKDSNSSATYTTLSSRPFETLQTAVIAAC